MKQLWVVAIQLMVFSFLTTRGYSCVWQMLNDSSKKTSLTYLHSAYKQSMASACRYHQFDKDLSNIYATVRFQSWWKPLHYSDPFLLPYNTIRSTLPFDDATVSHVVVRSLLILDPKVQDHFCVLGKFCSLYVAYSI